MAAQAMMMNHITQMGRKAMKKQKKEKKDKSSNKDDKRHGGRSSKNPSRKRRGSERSDRKEEEESNNDEPSELDREASCSEDQADTSGGLERAERRHSGSFESRDHGRGSSIRLVSRRHARNT